jgi:1,4-alpha-glucan branching enzyme
MTTKVNFILSAHIAGNATTGVLLGDFNNWDAALGCPLKKDKTGALKCTIALEAGKTYQYRYLLNDGRWVNDANASSYASAPSFQVENCVVTVQPATKTAIKKITKTPVKNVVEKIAEPTLKKVIPKKTTSINKEVPVKKKVTKTTIAK